MILEYGSELLSGLLVTSFASLLALFLSFVLGIAVAIARLTSFRILRFFGALYVEFFQNTPLLIQVFLFYVGLPAMGIQLSGFTSGSLGLGVYTSAFVAEALRAGLLSVPKGQWESSRASGLSYLQSMQFVILPQAMKLVIGPLGNQFINLIKNSAVLGIVAGGDLMYRADLISSQTFLVFEVYAVTAVLYLLLTIPLSIAIRRWEHS